MVPSRLRKKGRRNAGRRVSPTSAPLTFILPRLRGGQRRGRGARPAGRARLSAFHRGACGSEPTPPFSSSTRFRGRGCHQALPEAGLSQSSELLADRSWCRPGVFPEPPGNGSDEPPSAGTALAPAAGVTRRPSCSGARFVTFVSEIRTSDNENVTRRTPSSRVRAIWER